MTNPKTLALELAEDLRRAASLNSAIFVMGEVGLDIDEVQNALGQQLVEAQENLARLCDILVTAAIDWGDD